MTDLDPRILIEGPDHAFAETKGRRFGSSLYRTYAGHFDVTEEAETDPLYAKSRLLNIFLAEMERLLKGARAVVWRRPIGLATQCDFHNGRVQLVVSGRLLVADPPNFAWPYSPLLKAEGEASYQMDPSADWPLKMSAEMAEKVLAR